MTDADIEQHPLVVSSVRLLDAIERQESRGLQRIDTVLLGDRIAKPILDDAERHPLLDLMGLNRQTGTLAAAHLLRMSDTGDRQILLHQLERLKAMGFDDALRRLLAKFRAGARAPAAAPIEPPSVVGSEPGPQSAEASPPPPIRHRRRPIRHRTPPPLRRRTPPDRRAARRPAEAVQVTTDPVAIERANAEHESALDVLEAFLAGRGVQAHETDLIDLHAVLSDGSGIFEAKSLAEDRENERSQVLAAFAQLGLYEYLHRDAPSFGEGRASLWLLLSAAPRHEWYGFLRDHGIGLLWIEDGRLAGPGLDDLKARLPPEIQPAV